MWEDIQKSALDSKARKVGRGGKSTKTAKMIKTAEKVAPPSLEIVYQKLALEVLGLFISGGFAQHISSGGGLITPNSGNALPSQGGIPPETNRGSKLKELQGDLADPNLDI
jgi:hypothetical protein